MLILSLKVLVVSNSGLNSIFYIVHCLVFNSRYKSKRVKFYYLNSKKKRLIQNLKIMWKLPPHFFTVKKKVDLRDLNALFFQAIIFKIKKQLKIISHYFNASSVLLLSIGDDSN